jgi:hypothetical protein
MSCSPVIFQPSTKMLTCFFQIIFVQQNIPHFKWTLGQFFCGHHLNVHVSALRFSSRLD